MWTFSSFNISDLQHALFRGALYSAKYEFSYFLWYTFKVLWIFCASGLHKAVRYTVTAGNLLCVSQKQLSTGGKSNCNGVCYCCRSHVTTQITGRRNSWGDVHKSRPSTVVFTFSSNTELYCHVFFATVWEYEWKNPLHKRIYQDLPASWCR